MTVRIYSKSWKRVRSLSSDYLTHYTYLELLRIILSQELQ